MKFEKVSFDEFTKKFYELNENSNVSKTDLFKVYNEFELPKRGTKGSAGYDFVTPFTFKINPSGSIIIPTGVKCELDNDKVLQIYPRSSLGFKNQVMMANTVCIIDSDYYNNPDNEGHILINMVNNGSKLLKVNCGERFCQGLILQYFTTTDDNVVNTRIGGIGSTGK